MSKIENGEASGSGHFLLVMFAAVASILLSATGLSATDNSHRLNRLGGGASGWAATAHTGEHRAAPAPRALEKPKSLAERYCSAVGNKATDARFAWQADQLKKLSKDLEERRAILEERIAELKSWVERRDRFVELGTESLVKIFESMRPDAASEQLSSVDEMTAASIITKLKTRTASAILNEMDSVKAARLASTIAGAARYSRRQADKKGGGT